MRGTPKRRTAGTATSWRPTSTRRARIHERIRTAVYDKLGAQVGFEKKKRELSAAFAGAGAVFLLLGGTLSALWFGRIP